MGIIFNKTKNKKVTKNTTSSSSLKRALPVVMVERKVAPYTIIGGKYYFIDRSDALWYASHKLNWLFKNFTIEETSSTGIRSFVIERKEKK